MLERELEEERKTKNKEEEKWESETEIDGNSEQLRGVHITIALTPDLNKRTERIVRPTLIKRVVKTNIVVVRNSLQEQGGREGRMRRDLYTIDVSKKTNCYNYRDNYSNRDNLKEKKSLVVFD